MKFPSLGVEVSNVMEYVRCSGHFFHKKGIRPVGHLDLPRQALQKTGIRHVVDAHFAYQDAEEHM